MNSHRQTEIDRDPQRQTEANTDAHTDTKTKTPTQTHTHTTQADITQTHTHTHTRAGARTRRGNRCRGDLRKPMLHLMSKTADVHEDNCMRKRYQRQHLGR